MDRIRTSSGAETLKAGSKGPRGSIAEELTGAPRGGVSEGAYKLLKVHSTYEQFDRDTATVRKQAGQDKEWQFMVRVRAPGGGRVRRNTCRSTLSPAATPTARSRLPRTACGDVVRNVMTTPAPRRDAVHARLAADAVMLSTRLLPRSRGYYEIFLNEEASDAPVEEPVYGATYLPRSSRSAWCTRRTTRWTLAGVAWLARAG